MLDDRYFVDPNDAFAGEPSADELREVLEVSEPRANGRPSRVLTRDQLKRVTVADLQGTSQETPAHLRDGSEPIERFTLAELRREYPRLHPPVVDGLFREGETVNVISGSKIGKSWLSYNLALCIIGGRPWLDTFQTSAGRVILIDNELHRPTLSHRIPSVGDALSVPAAEYEYDLEIWPLRGRLRGLAELMPEFEAIDPGSVKAIILDAKYRFAVQGQSENDNAAETLFYNLVDRIAERTRAAIVMIHHSSKGLQGEKRTTDVGSGAGAQSRAADCHLVLREHEEDGTVVLDAAVRSFPPVQPLALRWVFPLWIPDGGADPSRLKGRLTKGEQRAGERDAEGIALLVSELRKGPATPRVLRTKTKLSKERCTKLLDRMEADESVTWTKVKKEGNWTREYQLSGVVDE